MHQELFNSQSSTPKTDTKNVAGGKAYKLDSQVALAKYVCTGTFHDTYQSSADEQLDKVHALCKECDPEFIAKLAVYGRQHGQMKDTPAFLVAYLAQTNIELCKKVFSKVIDNPKMLRNFVQVLRSGVVGRKSLGSAPRNLVRGFLDSLTDEQLFRSNIGNNPSLPDIIKMVHPKPRTKEREAMYAYLLGRKPRQEADKNYLLPLVQSFEAFKKDGTKDVPNVPFQMLTALPLSSEAWKVIASRVTFTQTRMNLNTFQRHEVFNDQSLVDILAEKLSNPEEVRKSRTFPYQLLTTYLNVEAPQKIKNALQSALEIACENVPTIEGDIYVALDTSGSMSHRVTGNRGSVTTKTRYIDVAALFAAAIQRKNKNAVILPFDTVVNTNAVEINPFDSIMTNAQKLAGIRGGGTDCSVALSYLNGINAKASAVIYISDNESWRAYAGKKYAKGTGMMQEWEKFAKRNPNAKLINIDISPSDTSQTANVSNTLLVGGFSDSVFDVIAGYLRGNGDSEYWLRLINEIKL